MHPKILILAVRDIKKGKLAAEEIEAYCNYKPQVWELDLCSFESVKRFAQKFESSGERLDILLSNAGVNDNFNWDNTADGYEKTIQTNHLSNMLLIHLLTPSLRATAKKFDTEVRVVVVASEVHSWAKFEQQKYPDPIDALNDSKRSSIKERYFVSKLLNIYMTRKFAQLFKDNHDRISIHSLNPGLCNTELIRNFPFLIRMIFPLFTKLIARTSEQGSRTLVHASVSEDLLLERGPNGRYWSSCKEVTPVLLALDDKLVKSVWDNSMTILEPYLKK